MVISTANTLNEICKFQNFTIFSLFTAEGCSVQPQLYVILFHNILYLLSLGVACQLTAVVLKDD